MHLAVFAADRDVFAVSVIAEALAGLVVVLRRLVIVEQPARVLGTAQPVNQAAELVILALPGPTHTAVLAVSAPQLGTDAPIGVSSGGDKFVAVPVGAGREFL
jgi:hypothetical protein